MNRLARRNLRLDGIGKRMNLVLFVDGKHMAWVGGSTYSPTTSRSLSTNFGSFESLPHAMRLKPVGAPGALAGPVRRLAGRIIGSSSVRATIRAATSSPSGLMRDDRVLSRSRPSNPSVAKRCCQRQTQVFDLPVRRMISTVPMLSAESSTISARQTCFWGRCDADDRLRPAAVGGTEGDGDTGAHAPHLHASEPTGILVRTHLSGSIH
jgi:hypothetical protein